MPNPSADGIYFISFPRIHIPALQQFLVKGPWACTAWWMIPLDGAKPVNPDERYRLRLDVGLDPRLTVLEIQVAYDAICDDGGKELRAGQKEYGSPFPTGVRSVERDLRMSEPRGFKIPSWKVRARAVVALTSDEFDIPDIAHHLNVPCTAGPVTVKCTQVYTDQQLFWNMEVTSTAEEVKPYYVTDMYDNNGKLLGRRIGTGNNRFGSGEGGGGPYRMHVTIPRKVKVLETEFEVKDLFLPLW
jgi:hypothetical protein